jgi:hypothetical protein
MLYGDDVAALPHHDSPGRDADRLPGSRRPVHQPVEQRGTLVAQPLQIVMDAGQGDREALADQVVIVHTHDGDLFRDAEICV